MSFRPVRVASVISLALALILVPLLLRPGLASAADPHSSKPSPGPSGDERRNPSFYWAPLPDTVTPMATSGVITAGSCNYKQAVDDPHPSSSPAGYASVHGWWIKWSGTCPAKANVDVTLQAWGCGSVEPCRWYTLDYNSADVYQGGGSGNRVNARHLCQDARVVGYRGIVDVDLIGVSDPAGETIAEKDVTCYPT